MNNSNYNQESQAKTQANTSTKMSTFDDETVPNALKILADAAAARDSELQRFNQLPDIIDSDEDSDSPCPVFDLFLNDGGPAAIISMTNFSPSEFEQIWAHLGDFVCKNYNVGRGKKYSTGGKDALFMTITVLKHGGQWDILARIFRMKGPSFERLITSFVRLVSPFAYQSFVTEVSKIHTMENMIENDQQFGNFKCARYATDVTFQQSFRPSGNIAEGKRYFSGKHKLYGYKVEASVLPNGLAIGCSGHYPGSVSDFEIFQSNREFHEEELRKSRAEREINDDGILATRYPRRWAVLGDKGYQGIVDVTRGITPKKKLPNAVLSVADEGFNRSVSSDRIIVENYFGRVCGLWTLLSTKWRWAENLYDPFFSFGIALCNSHVRWHPLRAQDFDRFQRIKNRTRQIGNDVLQNRQRVLERYRERRRRRLNVDFRNTDQNDTMDF